MAKQKSQKAPSPAVQNKETMQRLNFLYQTATYLQSRSTPSDGHASSLAILSRVHTKNLVAISRKSQTRIDPSVKRSICQECHATLLVGISASRRFNNSRTAGHRASTTCLTCRKGSSLPYHRGEGHRRDAVASSSSQSAIDEPSGTSGSPSVRSKSLRFHERTEHLVMI
ncbi:hypothetical protein DL93DRAFT_1264202 [Clavulina sp. PMI_390]|nr:hypothetical protein DL93DRAFT_1264202 [Clavulina sp. PMI_390]